MNNKFEIVVYWSEQDGHFLAEVPELPRIITDGVTRADALRHAEETNDPIFNPRATRRGRFQNPKVALPLPETRYS